LRNVKGELGTKLKLWSKCLDLTKVQGNLPRSKVCVTNSWWRIQTHNTRIVGDWRTRLKTWSWGQGRLSLRLQLLYCNSKLLYSFKLFLKEIYFSIFRFEIGKETYQTTKWRRRKFKNSLITSFVFFTYLYRFPYQYC
jgi:hypothetical protein